MNKIIAVLGWALVAIASGGTISGQAAEQLVLRFVESPSTTENVVRLRDLVEVLDGDLSRIELHLDLPLGPAPRTETSQTWLATDVMQHLKLRGVEQSAIRWSGDSSCQLTRLDPDDVGSAVNMAPAFVQQRTRKQAENLVTRAIIDYLNLRTGETVDWQISVRIPEQALGSLQSRRHIAGIGGGEEPWDGEQQFVLQVRENNNLRNISVEATVGLPPLIVVATRPLRRDEIIASDMIELQPAPVGWNAGQADYFSDPRTLIGKQLRRSASTGLPITSNYVGEPTIIGRNELVEVESVSGPVTVRTTARSLGSGARGDLIEIEMVPSKRRMLATIVGPLKVRVAGVASRGNLVR